MREVIFVNVNYEGNAGDFWSTPLKYYDFSEFNVRHVHFMDVWDSIQGNFGYEHADIKNKLVIIGGGGLLTTKDNFMQKTTEHLVENNKVIFWGVGSNTFETPTYDILTHPNVILAGIRDIVYGVDLNYLPCVSCKNSLFDKSYNIVEEIGVIEHPRLPIPIDKYPKINNQSNLENILNFIGTKKTILSSTYHGVYWSQLLNKEVLYFKSSERVNSKFINMKNRIPICSLDDFEEKTTCLSFVNGMLNESRKLNDNFYKNVIQKIKEYSLG